MDLFDGESNSYGHHIPQLQWYSTILPRMGTILWNLKLGDLVGKIPFILCIVHNYIQDFFCLSHFS